MGVVSFQNCLLQTEPGRQTVFLYELNANMTGWVEASSRHITPSNVPSLHNCKQ